MITRLDAIEKRRLSARDAVYWGDNQALVDYVLETDMPLLMSVAEAAARLADAYRAWDDSLVAGPSPVRVTALLRDVLVASCEVQKAVAPLLEEAE